MISEEKENLTHSLFLNELPLVDTKEELERIIARYKDCDPYFIVSGCIKERREKFNSLWNQFKFLADKHFLLQVKKEFHERSWEMYIGCLLNKYLKNIYSEDSGPDFVINKGEKEEIFIEAVACKKGNSVDAVPDMIIAEQLEEITVQDVPHDEMLLRLSSSIKYKANKYKNFINKKNKPYIIAVNKGALRHPDPQIPLIFKCLFGFGYEHFKKVNGQLKYNGWTRRRFIEKKNGKKISMEFFGDEENNFVSAIIYSSIDVLNSPQNIGDDCILIHNPRAKFPINKQTFSFLKQWNAECMENGYKLSPYSNLQ